MTQIIIIADHLKQSLRTASIDNFCKRTCEYKKQGKKKLLTNGQSSHI